MKRRIFAVLLISGILLLAAAVGGVWFSGASGSFHERVSVRIELGQMKARKVGGFDWISLPDCSHISLQGHPALPIKSVVVKLPRNTESVKIGVIEEASVILPGKYMVAAALKPEVISNDLETKFFDNDTRVSDGGPLFSKPLPEIYNSSAPYPAKLFDFYSSKGREYNYVMVYFYPVRFVPTEGGLTLINEATFDVEYTMEAEGPESLGNAALDQVIVAAPAYETEADTLAAWRNATQIRTSVFTTDWIYSTYAGVDEPEKIRNFIGDMFSSKGIKYVLLFGDEQDVPTRFAYVPDGEDAGAPDGIEVPTDYYYECLEGTWDPNGDGKYADLENDDYTQIDFIPEVSVGRLSVDGATASSVVDKIIEYEKNIDPAWSERMVLAATDPFKEYAGAEGEILKDHVEEILQGNYTEFTKLYETMGTLSTSTISDNINLGCGGIDFAGHGHYELWSLEGAGTYTNSDAAGLSNGNKLPIVATMACLTAGFDSQYHAGNCLGEEFLRNPNGGSAAYVGATRNAWGYSGEGIITGLAGELDWRFWESHKLGDTQPGPMLSEAKIRYIANHPLDTTYQVDGGFYYLDEKTVLEYVLLGDPVLFAEKPATLAKTYKDSAYSEESKFFTVNAAVYIEADVRGYGGANISGADVYAELYVDGGLQANITLTHLGGGSSLYRGSWVSSSSSGIGVYLANVTVSSLYESASGSNRFHLYSGSGVSAYRLDFNEDGSSDYVLENRHLISVYDGKPYTEYSLLHLYQKDTDVSYTFRETSDIDTVGSGEISTSDMKEIDFHSFFLQEGENLISANLEMKTNVTEKVPGGTQSCMFDDDDIGTINNAKGCAMEADFTATASGTLEFYVRCRAQTILESFDIMLEDSSGAVGPDVYFINGNIGYYDGSQNTIMAYTPDQWYHFKIGFDCNTDTMDIYVDDMNNPKVSGAGFWNTLTEISGIILDTGQWVTGWPFRWDQFDPLCYVDNIYVYSGATHLFTEDFEDHTPGSDPGSPWTVTEDSALTNVEISDTVYYEEAAGKASTFNITIKMKSEDVDYLAYKLHNFDQNISDIEDIFPVISGSLYSVDDDRYHLEDGSDGLITSLTADQWNDHTNSNYTIIYDNSTIADPVSDVVIAWVRFNETQNLPYQDAGLWNDTSYHAEALRIRYNASQATATDEVAYILVFTKGNWETIDEWMSTIESGEYPDPNFANFPSPAVHLLLAVEPSEATYFGGEELTLMVNVFNLLNPPLEGTLTLTVTGPGDYYLFDFERISVAADAVSEYGFSFVVPDVAGTYYVEVSLIPPSLTAYDAVWLEVV